jgi:guanine deaminase
LGAAFFGSGLAAAFLAAGAGFAAGDALHAIVVDDSNFPEAARPLTLRERFERAIYMMNKDNITAVWSQGKCVVKNGGVIAFDK